MSTLFLSFPFFSFALAFFIVLLDSSVYLFICFPFSKVLPSCFPPHSRAKVTPTCAFPNLNTLQLKTAYRHFFLHVTFPIISCLRLSVTPSSALTLNGLLVGKPHCSTSFMLMWISHLIREFDPLRCWCWEWYQSREIKPFGSMHIPRISQRHLPYICTCIHIISFFLCALILIGNGGLRRFFNALEMDIKTWGASYSVAFAISGRWIGLWRTVLLFFFFSSSFLFCRKHATCWSSESPWSFLVWRSSYLWQPPSYGVPL